MTLNFVESGDPAAPALLLGGSLGTTHAMWAPQLQRLSDRFRVVAFDHRGHGDSHVPPGPYAIADLATDVVALADALELDTFHYAGVSIGGMVGQWLASNEPDRVDRLVLICTTAFAGPPDPWTERAQTVRGADGTVPIADAVVARWTTPEFAEANAETVDSLKAMLLATPAEGYASCCEAIGAMDQRESLAAITAPTLVVHSRDDPAISFDHGERLAQAIPGARLVPVRPGAHIPGVARSSSGQLATWPSVERPDLINDLITEHLA